MDGGRMVMPVKALKTALAGVILAMAWACGGGGGGTPDVAPTLSVQPADLAVNPGDPATFSVTATGTAPLTYQWRKGGAALSGATAATYTLAAAAASDAGAYDVVVSNKAGSVTSRSATLTVKTVAPTITTQPVGGEVFSGNAFTLLVAASGTAPLTYQWSKDGTALAGATDARYFLAATAVSDSGTYTCKVTNAAGSATSNAAVLSVMPPTTFDLTIDTMYIVQSTQDYAGTVPLVAGKDGLLRVFVKATEANTAKPQVRVRLYNGATLLQTWTIQAPGASVPTVMDESSLAGSWNLPLAGSFIQPGYSILADVDPGGTILEQSKVNNAYPTSGSPLPLTVSTVPTWAVTLIPITQGGLTANLTADNLGKWTTRLGLIAPVATLDVKLGAAYTTSTTLSSDGTGWSALLAELEAKRIADGVQASRYYFGAVATSYASGTAGLGYVPGAAATTGYRSALGWDKTGYSDGGNYPEVLAHEVGHNFGRNHAPCGNPGNVDTAYPYAGAQLGVYGYNTATGLVQDAKSTLDIMSYCHPLWISDYTFKGMLTWRLASGLGDVVTAGAAVQDGLLAWGRTEGGAWILEPAFRVRGVFNPGSGPHAVQAVDAEGREVAAVEVDTAAVGCGNDPAERAFAVFIPLGTGDFDRIHAIRLKTGSQVLATRQAGPTTAGVAELRVLPSGGATLRWTSGHPAALVRSPRTGEVLAIARDGAVDIPAAQEVDVQLSDGVHTRQLHLKPAQAVPTSLD